MRDTYESDAAETPDSPATQGYDRAALESRMKQVEPMALGAPDQMTDTPIHTQGDAPDCLLQSARMAEHRQTGKDPGVEAFKEPVIERGLYDPQMGADVQGVADVMNERPGIEATLQNASGPEEIKTNLDQGDSVIAGVDAGAFYDINGGEPNGAGHAVVVTGADQSTDGSWDFTVNDPNEVTPNTPVDGDRFLSAWEQMDRTMLTVHAKGDA